MSNLYIAHHYDKDHNTPSNFIKNLRLLKKQERFSKIQTKKILSFRDLERFIKKINPQTSGTFVLYFNGHGKQEKDAKIGLTVKESLIIGKTEIPNKSILELINKPEYILIKFYIILEACNSGQFIRHAKNFSDAKMMILSATSENQDTTNSNVTNFLNIISYGLFNHMIKVKTFENMFNNWFGEISYPSPQCYFSVDFVKKNSLLFY